MGTLVFVAAERRELAGFLRHMAQPVRLRWPVDWSCSAELRGRRCLMVANGFGASLAGQALDIARAQEGFEAVISTGFCGALDAALKPAEIFVAVDVRTMDRGKRFTSSMPRVKRPFASGILLSGDCVIQSAEEKRALRSAGYDAVDMEALSLAERASDWRLPFYCVRAVTDTADEGFACDFNAARGADGRLSYTRLLFAACRKPAVQLPELWRLRRRSISAARALGDFLADCDF